jgi:hypothetical protein
MYIKHCILKENPCHIILNFGRLGMATEIISSYHFSSLSTCCNQKVESIDHSPCMPGLIRDFKAGVLNDRR